MTDRTREHEQKRSLFSLIGSLPGLVVELVKSELDQLKNELLRKLKHAGIGVGLLGVAAVFAFFATGVLTAAAILGLAVVLPGWLAALIVAALLLIFVAIFVLLGVRELGKGNPEPTETITSIKRDVRVIKGTAKRRTP
ncbi:phage holin family protein [Leifsonia bigeumensis]|uniref:Phage holin family protein n=1 Tax=Leifsonella bigeumensis TaxID=433643 RepID=A0ABP7F0F6_9MICO